ncbi:lactoylglutathione lyase [Algicola sagamiensis]|uniref:lactoylglutathione lyase n=1 Tax=Algicola sagamiensis TaxID=163869 RepID=UPI0003708051|nr:lactoylglutathione lyase [Algicola sagamiensis]
MKLLHTMLRVTDLERSIHFYTNMLNMKLDRKIDNVAYRYTLAYLKFSDDEHAAELELTWNWDEDNYEMGNAYGHIAIGVDDIYASCEALAQKAVEISRAPGPVAGGKILIAFIRDPDGYPIELIQL